MVLDLSAYSASFKFLYSDLCDVYRYITTLDEHGATRKERNDVPIYQDVACLISPEQADDANPRTISNIPLEQFISIHTTPDIKLVAGDYLVLKKLSKGQILRRYRGTIGEPKAYPTHIKATLKLDKAED